MTTTRRFAGAVDMEDFPPGLDWLNVRAPLSLSQLRGRIVILDVWTSC